MICGRTSSPVAADDTITAAQSGTLWGLFRERVRRSPGAIAYRDYDTSERRWRDHSWAAMSELVDRFSAALAHDNMVPGDRVAVLLPNGVDWVSLDLAAHALGLVVVGLYPHETAATNAYILGHSDARLVLLDSEPRWASLSPFLSDLPALDCVWI